jgi:hypothetical protein
MAPVCCRPDLGLSADDPRVGEAPGLRRGDHRTGERARSEPVPRPGSVQSCDGHSRPAGAGGRDGWACRVRGGGDRRAAGPRAHVQRRRPHDSQARHQTWCMWTDDRLNHDSHRDVKRTGYDKSRRRRYHESHDSCGAHRVCSAAAIVSIGTRLPVTESSPCAGSVNQTRARCVAEDQRWMCNSAALTGVAHVRFRDGSFRWSHAHARPGRWIACREALRRRLVDIGGRTLARWPTRGFIATTVSWTAVVDALVFHLYLAREFRVPPFHCSTSAAANRRSTKFTSGAKQAFVTYGVLRAPTTTNADGSRLRDACAPSCSGRGS